MQDDRAIVMAAIGVVDLVCLFDEDTPLALITAIVPDVLVKGADWPIEKVVGREVVEAAGGQVQTIEFIPDRSTTSIIDRIRSSAG
jgi:D-beta-D-heptose 7-phosphate kinase/D-beta-D-heptose 1-phosphate adenosyltransferase